jgi:hypothetical protein
MGSRLLVGFLAVSGCFGQLTQGERDRAMSHLHASRKAFLDSIEGLSEAQWRFKPDAQTWSIAEVAEHIALSEDRMFGLVTQKIMKSPAAPERKAEVEGKDELVMKVIPDRTRKATAPEALVPTGKWPDRAALAAHFRQRRDEAIRYVQTTPDDMRSHFQPHPAVQVIDAYQWLLLMAAHSERHIAQIEEVKAHSAFPKR